MRIIPLGGTTSVSKNMYVYEHGDSIFIVDCGIGFPDSTDYGVDLVIPDFKYILENRHKVKGLLITHGHEDHFGAVPFLLNELKIPVYSTKLVLGFIRNKLNDFGIKDGIDFRPFDADSILEIGPFKIVPFSINHSVPNSLGFAIRTLDGLIIHVSDFKFDWTPVMDRPFDIGKLADLCKGGVDLLLSDCLGSTSQGYTESERYIEDTFNELLSKAEGQVIITTMSSNISRVYQAIRASLKHNRKVAISGRSIEQNIEVARNLGLLDFPKEIFVPLERVSRYPQDKITYLVAGSYGQNNSSLYRIASETHKQIKLEKGAMVIFSADPNPPGVLEAVNYVIDRLTLLGADVLYSAIQENLHVSGHGSIGDISMLAAIVKPKAFMPIGGTVKFMRAYKNLMSKMGFREEAVFELLDGESLVMEKGSVKKGGIVPVGNIYVDGAGIGDVGSVVLRDRQELADSGIVVVVLPYKRSKRRFGENIEIVSRGFVYVKESKKLISEMEGRVRKVLKAFRASKEADIPIIKGRIEKEISKFIFKETQREPIIVIAVLNI